MKLSAEKIKQFQEKILTWYEEHKRSLPWRDVPYGTSLQDAPDGTPLQERGYMILVSEVMSQQTQISRVVPKFEAWMKKFPTVESLAAAKVSDVLQYWSGLGYNRRALNLKKTAEIIVKNYHGIFPKTEKELLKLPGIGKYTARAILCFAFGEQLVVVDTNVRKVILIEVLKGTKGTDEPEVIENIAKQLLPVGMAYDWNQALMDYAATVLKKEKIPVPKQSTFIGSRRYYRGQVLKYLLKHEKVTFEDLGQVIKKDYTIAEEVWLQKLVRELTDEGFIVEEQGTLVLVS